MKGSSHQIVDSNLTLLLQTPRLSRVRPGPNGRLVLDPSFFGRFLSKTQKDSLHRAISLTFEQALAEVVADPIDVIQKYDRYVLWLNILPRLSDKLGRWCRIEWFRTWQASILQLKDAISDMLLEAQVYSRWYILLPSGMIFFELIRGVVRLDPTAETKLVQMMDYQTVEFTDGFLHLRNRSSHLDYPAWLHSGLAPSMNSIESIGQGPCFIETFLGRLYFTPDTLGRVRASASARKAFLMLGPLTAIHVVTTNGRRWLRMDRPGSHPTREYLMQTSTLAYMD